MAVPAIVMQESDVSFGRGVGGGLGELGGGILDRVNLSAFGFDRAMEGTLEGTLYDFKRDKDGQALKTSGGASAYVGSILTRFTNNFSRQHLDKYYKPDTKLYGAYFIIPNRQASEAPRAFKAEGEVAAKMLAVAYKGSFRPQESGRFRLFGRGDNVLIVRINGRIVLDASWYGPPSIYTNWKQSQIAKRHQEKKKEWFFGVTDPKQPCVTGNWFDLREGVETDIEVIIGETSGGVFGAYLLAEKEGEPGRKIFSTRPLSQQDKVFLINSHTDAKKFLE
jgi:hypothetical protein